MKKRTEPTPTDEDRAEFERQIATLHERMKERLIVGIARQRVAREAAERRRQRLNRLTLGLLGRR